jgi:hypothetical protein
MRVAFYKGTRPGIAGIYSRITRLWMRGPYSHCEVVFSDGMAASSSFEDGGVRFKAIDFDPVRWDLVDLRGFDEAAAREWFTAHEGQAYDLFGLVGFVMRPFTGGKRNWVCSESVAAALQYADGWRFDPNALYAVLTRAQAKSPAAVS